MIQELANGLGSERTRSEQYGDDGVLPGETIDASLARTSAFFSVMSFREALIETEVGL